MSLLASRGSTTSTSSISDDRTPTPPPRFDGNAHGGKAQGKGKDIARSSRTELAVDFRVPATDDSDDDDYWAIFRDIRRMRQHQSQLE